MAAILFQYLNPVLRQKFSLRIVPCNVTLRTLSSNDATASRTSLKKWICILSVFIAIFPTILLCQMWANTSGVEFLRNIAKFQERNKISSLLVYILHKTREIVHFQVVVVQIRQRNVQKSVMHVQSCCFSYYTNCCFDILFAVGSLDLDVPNISSKNPSSFLFLLNSIAFLI